MPKSYVKASIPSPRVYYRVRNLFGCKLLSFLIRQAACLDLSLLSVFFVQLTHNERTKVHQALVLAHRKLELAYEKLQKLTPKSKVISLVVISLFRVFFFSLFPQSF